MTITQNFHTVHLNKHTGNLPLEFIISDKEMERGKNNTKKRTRLTYYEHLATLFTFLVKVSVDRACGRISRNFDYKWKTNLGKITNTVWWQQCYATHVIVPKSSKFNMIPFRSLRVQWMINMQIMCRRMKWETLYL